jgi:hypothetical protein
MKCGHMHVTSNPVFLPSFSECNLYFIRSLPVVVQQSLPISIDKHKPVRLKDGLCEDVMRFQVSFALMQMGFTLLIIFLFPE